MAAAALRINRWARGGFFACRSTVLPEKVHVDRDPTALQVVVEPGDEAGGDESADDRALTVETLLLELADVLHGDHLRLHAGDLADRRHPAGPVREPRLLDDEVDGAGDVLPAGAHGPLPSAHQHHSLH